MQLIGMFDSPFVRRVAVSMNLLGMPFEHRNWSVGADFERIRQYNPLGRVPTLVLDDGEALAESGAILDFLDQQAGPDRALLPDFGADRQRALQLMAQAVGAAEKGVLMIYEGAFRPAEKRHEPWVARCRTQMEAGLAVLDQACAARDGAWLVGNGMTQADITLACVFRFLAETQSLGADARFRHIARHAAGLERLPAFSSVAPPPFHVPAG
ncbi:MAG: glutathione S-transferase family protein [Panacagrimonas sp.]